MKNLCLHIKTKRAFPWCRCHINMHWLRKYFVQINISWHNFPVFKRKFSFWKKCFNKWSILQLSSLILVIYANNIMFPAHNSTFNFHYIFIMIFHLYSKTNLNVHSVLNLYMHSSQCKIPARLSQCSKHCLCTKYKDPLHRHGEMNLKPHQKKKENSNLIFFL